MATTKTKKKSETKEVAVDAKKAKTHPLIIGPRITEKSAIASERGTYVFNVAPVATKNEIKKAIKMLYGVTPVKVAIIQITSKVVVRRGVPGTKQGGKKAVVSLKKGDTIAFA
jgi:large subunit ribosomal protein L23